MSEKRKKTIKTDGAVFFDDYVDSVQINQLDFVYRELYLVGESDLADDDGAEPGVEYTMASRLIKNIRILSLMSHDPILIHLKSCGGDIIEGMAIYDAIRLCPCKVIMLNYTHARSMTSIIFQAANKRVMMPSSYYMIHEGSYGAQDTYKGMKSMWEFDQKWHYPIFFQVYIDRMKKKGLLKGKSDKEVMKYIQSKMDKNQEFYLTPTEAIEHGLADSIFNGNWDSLKKVR